MHVQVAVDVVERQAGGAEGFELRVHFRAQLFAQVALDEIAKTDANRAVAELAARVDEAGDFFRRQRGMPHQQSQMQANPEIWILFRERDGFGAGRFVHHQAGGGEDAFAMRADDGFVD